MKKMIIASTSTLYDGKYLEYIKDEIAALFRGKQQVLFVPFARPGGISWDDYTARASAFFSTIGLEVQGLHAFDDKPKAILDAEAIFIGGGNTFVLVNELYRHKLIPVLKHAVNSGTPYLGSSAGSNITGLSMQTTNDMPIVQVPDYRTIGALPFNLNPHYLDPDPNGKHMGETRETRIKEFHVYNSVPVLGLREGSWLEVAGDTIILKGNQSARLFRQQQTAQEMESGSDLSQLR
ncbi:MAG: dipeptidase PepE [Moraxellaceae bacterium]|nr:MAG: dipeptidase PepE [Moraxellaceae bacterium]